MELFPKPPARFCCSYCGGVSIATNTPGATSTVQSADAVGFAIAFLERIAEECPTISAPQTRRALATISAELAACRAAMIANDGRLVKLQLELLRSFENIKRDLAKPDKKREKKGNTPASCPAIVKA